MLGLLLFNLNSKAQRCLTYIKCSPAVLEVHEQNAVSSNSINIFHQNIRRLRSKRLELTQAFEIDNI
jgi:hypothetical protein